MVAKATKIGSLYQLDYKANHEQASFAEKSDTKEDIWHKRFGHLGIGSLQKLAHKKLAEGLILKQMENLPSVKPALKANSIVVSWFPVTEEQTNLCIVISVEK